MKQAVPFFGVTDIDASLRFYVDGLGFTMTLKLGSRRDESGGAGSSWASAAVMLQE